MLRARQTPETLELEMNLQIVYLDIKNLYTSVPVSEANEVALRCLYSSDTPYDIEKSTHELLLKLAVTNVCFENNGNLYCHRLFAMGASLAVILANILMKKFEEKLSAEDYMSSVETENSNKSDTSLIKSGLE